MNMFGLTTRGLEISSRSLDLTAAAASVSAGNIANADVPGYKAATVEFEKVMAEALKTDKEGGMTKTDPRHLPVFLLGLQRSAVGQRLEEPRMDGNTVELEGEVTRLSEMNMKYSAYSTVANKEIGILKSAISLSAQ